MRRIKLRVAIRLLTPLHVGGDVGVEANTSYMLRDGNGVAYYPGTAFKGKVRHYARSLHKEDCVFPDPCKCTVCRLFGGEGNARGSLLFENFLSVGKPLSDIRTGNSIDRFRRVVEDEKLFTTESAAIRELVGYISGNIEDGDLELLRQSIKLVQHIGGNTSRGFGWVDGEIMISEEKLPQEITEAEYWKVKGVATRLVDAVRLTLTLKTPLLVGTHTTQSNFRDTQHVIPGAVIRAAMARAICECDGTTDPSPEGIANDLPSDRETFFPHLRNSFGDLRFGTLHSNKQPEPFPMTSRRCKFHGEKHKSVDVLASTLRGEDVTCPDCKGRLIKREPIDSLPTVVSVHSEIDKRRGTARDGRLYTLRAIAPDEVVF